MSKKQLIEKAYALFDEFYTALTPLRHKCTQNDEFWKTNHWHGVAQAEAGEPRPVTPVLFSTLESLLSDIMDNYPEPVILPEEEGDEALAQSLQDIVHYILRRRNYKSTFRSKCRSALKKGTSVQEVYWDRYLYNGLGDVNIRQWDIRNFLFDPGVSDIQDGRACFKFGFFHRDYFLKNYPGVWEKMKSHGYIQEQDEGGKESSHALLMEYWYKEINKEGNVCVHMAKLAGGVLLEDSKATAPEGMYAHGMYPFIVEPLFPLDNQPIGLGLIDVLKNLQQYADKLDQIILKNALMSGKMKLLINKNADLDEAALADWSKEVIRGSRIDDAAVRWFQPSSLNPYVLHHFNGKLAAIKEESGQNQFVRGESVRGVTAASAIMALQEAGSKRSRLIIDGMYDGFEQLIRMVVEVIRENYTEERRVIVNGETVKLSADMLKKYALGQSRPIDFDVSVAVQKQTPYKTVYQNEFALILLKNNLITEEDALNMMHFEGKEKILKSITLRREEAQKAAKGQSEEKLNSVHQSIVEFDEPGN